MHFLARWLKFNVALLVVTMASPFANANALDDLLNKYPKEKETAAPAVPAQKSDRAPASTTKAKPERPKPANKPKAGEPKPEIRVTPPEAPAATAAAEEEESGLFGQWGGYKSALKEKGYDLNLTYKGDSVTNLKGGTERKSGYLGNIDLTLDMNMEKLVGAKGLTFSLYGLGDHGDDPTEYVGDSFATSNIESPNAFKLYEVYLQQNLDDQTTLLLGVRDLNADFYALDAAGTLINSAFGISPSLSQTGVNGPSIFPQASMAMTFRHESPTGLYFQAGAFNAQSGDPARPYGTHIHTIANEGYLYIWEAGFARTDEVKGTDKYGIGAWNYSKPQDAVNTANDPESNWGFYGLAQHSFNKHFALFAKYGIANDSVNEFKAGSELGAAYEGLIRCRPDDVLSIGYARAAASGDYQDLGAFESYEEVYEIAYKIKVMNGFSVTPDLQTVRNPGLAKSASDAQVGTVRFELNF